MKDVAAEAGVSESTASLALSGKGRVGEKTKQMIISTAERLGYRSSAQAPERVVRIVAFIETEGIRMEVYMAMIHGAVSRLKKIGYSAILDICDDAPFDNRELRERHLKRSLESSHPVLIIPHWSIELDDLYVLFDGGIPFIVLGQSIPGFDRNYIAFDHYQGATTAMEFLIQKGHRRIAHITGPANQPHGEQRLSAYLDCLAKHEIEKRPEYIVKGEFDERSGVKAIEKLLSLETKPTAIFASNDRSALGAMHRAEELGYNVPTDLSIVGYDDSQAARASHPRLTTVSQPLFTVGQEGAQLLADMLKTGQMFVKRVFLSSKLVVRSTVAAAS